MSTSKVPVLLADQAEGVVTLTLNRPDQYNALSDELLAELQAHLDSIAQDDDVRCVVLAASGKAFCTGHDLKQMRANRDRKYYERLFAACGRMMQSIVALPVPVIAKVQGTATAAGCQLVASCDLAVSADTAKFAVSGINVGLFCSTPAVALSRNIPIKKAFEMLITGRFIGADEAVNIGLLNKAVSIEELDATVAALAQTICCKSPVAVRAGKAMYQRQRAMNLSDAYDFAADVSVENMMAQDVTEGIDAFMEKRSPIWKGC